MGATEEGYQPSRPYTFLPNVTAKQQLLTTLFAKHFISAYKAKLGLRAAGLTKELTEHINGVFVDASACFSEIFLVLTQWRRRECSCLAILRPNAFLRRVENARHVSCAT